MKDPRVKARYCSSCNDCQQVELVDTAAFPGPFALLSCGHRQDVTHAVAANILDQVRRGLRQSYETLWPDTGFYGGLSGGLHDRKKHADGEDCNC